MSKFNDKTKLVFGIEDSDNDSRKYYTVTVGDLKKFFEEVNTEVRIQNNLSESIGEYKYGGLFSNPTFPDWQDKLAKLLKHIENPDNVAGMMIECTPWAVSRNEARVKDFFLGDTDMDKAQDWSK